MLELPATVGFGGIRVADAEPTQKSHKGQGNSSAGQNQGLSLMAILLQEVDIKNREILGENIASTSGQRP